MRTTVSGMTTVSCPICGTEYEVMAACEGWQDFLKVIGAQEGNSCAECSKVIIDGTPEQLRRFLLKHGKAV